MESEDALRKRTFGGAMRGMQATLSRCLAPGGECDQEGIRAHSVQNSRVLDRLQRDGHVVAPKMDISFQGGPRSAFEEVGRNIATTFHGLCAEHDASIFRPIDTAAIRVDDPEHLFLLSYRAVMKAVQITQHGYQTGVETGLFPNEPCAPGYLAVEHMVIAWQTYLHKLLYDVAFLTRNWATLQHDVGDLNVAPGVAANALLCSDRYCKETDSNAYATFNVMPIGETTYLAVSFLEEHRDGYRRSFKRHLDKGPILRTVSELILRRCENFVIAPALFDSFSDAQRAECLRTYERNIGPCEWDPDRPHLVNLFGSA